MDPNAHFPAGALFNGFTPLKYGWLGVELFFVISGFVILMTLERSRNVGDFACRRFARLWPPLFVAATLTTLTMFLVGPTDWVVSKYDYMTSIVLVDPSITAKLLNRPNLKWVDGVYWSLWVEIRFYVLSSIIYLAARRKFVIIWIIFWITAEVTALLVPHYGKINALLNLICFPPYLPYFTIGICVYEIHSKGVFHRFALAGAVLAACAILYSATFGHNIYHGHNALISVIGDLAIFSLLLLFIIDHPIVGIFKSRPLVVLGQASYSLYLIHQNIGVSIMSESIKWGAPYLIVLPVTICFMIAVSLLLFNYVEIPAKSWILRRSENLILGIEGRVPWLSYTLNRRKD